jgi:hypothetical protein
MRLAPPRRHAGAVIQHGRILMRTAASLAGALIVAGIYLAIAASLALPATWIGLGMLVIAGVTSVSLVAAAPRQTL